ncbi:MAG TPA: FAD-dependent monooxygenase, partial [Asanoa sp.]|nr:FAD-dependent monooxygenase [Asanoa sp.]
HDCLPPAGWQSFLDTVSTGDGGFGFLTDRCTDLLGLADAEINDPTAAPPDRHYGVSRILLREILLDGLDDVVHLGRTFVGYDLSGDRVTARFADGSTATADVLIGADGANSRVRGQLLPQARRVDTGVVAVAGRYPLSPESAAALPPVLTGRTNLVLPRGRGSLFTAVWRRAAGDSADYAIWGFSDAADRFPADVDKLDGAELRHLVTDRIRGWSPAFRRLVECSDPATVNALRVKSAAPVDPWPTGRVTLLGDAIHNMTPMAGVGANTALRDADLLRHELRVLRMTAAVPPMRRGMARRLGN